MIIQFWSAINKHKFLLATLLSLILSACGSGQAINEAFPSTKSTILPANGEQLDFEVKGPTSDNFVYIWQLKVLAGDNAKKVTTLQQGQLQTYSYTVPSNFNRIYQYLELKCHLVLTTDPNVNLNDPNVNWDDVETAQTVTWEIKSSTPPDQIIVNGSLAIKNKEDVAGLELVETIKGDLIIESLNFKPEKIFTALTRVEGDLKIGENRDIRTLEDLGLETLTYVGGEIRITSNPALISLAGLENITNVRGDLRITYNTKLTSLLALSSIQSVGGKLELGFLQSLGTVRGLHNISTIGGSLVMLGNDDLSLLEPMYNLSRVGGNVSFTLNHNLCESKINQLIDNVESSGGIGGQISMQLNRSC